MTDPTKKDDSDKAKAVKDAMTGTPDTAAKTAAERKPAEPVKEPPKPEAPKPAAAPTAAGAKPPTSEKEPSKAPVKGSVPASSASTGRSGAASGGTEPPRGPGGPQGPGAPKGPATPSASAASQSPPPKKPAPPPKKKRGCLGTLIWLVVIVAALAAAAYYTWPHWPDAVKNPVEAKIAELVPTVQTPAEKAALEDRIDGYQKQLSALESKVAELADRKVLTEEDVKALAQSGGEKDAGNADLSALTTRLDADVSALTARLDAIEKAITSVNTSQTSGDGGGPDAAAVAGATAAIGASVQALSQRIQTLEDDVATAKSVEGRVATMEQHAAAAPSGEAKAAVVLAVSHLNQAVMQSAPFTAELDSLKAVAGDDAGLTEPIGVLEPQAANGVPSLIELRASFPEVAKEVSRVQADWTGEDWVDKALSRVTSLVSVRKTGEEAMAAQGVDGVLAQAEAALLLGDVEAAVKAMEGLDGPPAEAAAPWLAQAQKRLDAMAALAALRQGAIELLAKGG